MTTRFMWRRIAAGCAVAAAVLPLCGAAAVEPGEDKLPAVVGRIGKRSVSRAELVKYVVATYPNKKRPASFTVEKAPCIWHAFTLRLVDDMLMTEVMRDKKITVSPEEVKKYFRWQFALLSADERRLLDKRLQWQKKTVDKLIAEQAADPQVVREVAMYNWFEREFGASITVSEADIRKNYDSNVRRFVIPPHVDVAHIMIPYNPKQAKTKTGAVAKMAEISAILQQTPQRFAELAAKYSKCPSASDGGRLGAIVRNQCHRNFESAAFALTKGAVSGVVDTGNSLHIVKCLEQIPERRIAYEEIKDDILQMLRNQEMMKKTETFVTELRRKNDVEILVKMPEYQELELK